MKTVFRSTTALGMSLLLAMPSMGAAQDLDSCRIDGAQNVFPCMMEGTVIRSADELTAGLDGLAEGDTAPAPVDSVAVERGNVTEEQERARLEAEAAAAQEQADLTAQQEADAAAAAQAKADAEAAAQLDADLKAQQDADAAAAAQAQADQQAAAQAETDLKAQQEAEAQAEADRAALRAQRQAERQAELDAAAAAAAAAAEGQGTGEVVTEQVTEESLRTSDEEFESAVTGDGAAAVEEDGDDGLSKFEKALLLGLGAVVVGSVLKNGDTVRSRSGDRLVVEDPNGDLRVLKDDDALIRRPGDQVSTETFNDGSSRSIVSKPDGSQVITVRGRDGVVLRRVNIDPQGNEYVLFDDLQAEQAVVVQDLPRAVQGSAQVGAQDEAALRAALMAQMAAAPDRRFSLRQVRDISQVRALAPELELDAVRFETGSAAIRPEQARSLSRIGNALNRLIADDPRVVILVEGHTDAVGDATYNLALSDRRAETVALALTEYFDVPPENMITQGYGESALKVPTPTSEPANRRAVVRNITGLLR